MWRIPIILASMELVPGSGVVPEMTPEIKDGLIILGVVILLASALIVWAVLARRKRRRGRSRHAQTEPAVLVRYRHPRHEDVGFFAALKPRRRRRKHRSRRRNPTLAETGGLPPLRPPEPPPPSSPPTA